MTDEQHIPEASPTSSRRIRWGCSPPSRRLMSKGARIRVASRHKGVSRWPGGSPIDQKMDSFVRMGFGKGGHRARRAERRLRNVITLINVFTVEPSNQ
jgi:hypothetical protein